MRRIGYFLTTILIFLLVAGISGSWVVRQGTLCGIVYAAYEQTPYLHMLCAEDIFRDLSEFLRTDIPTLKPPPPSALPQQQLLASAPAQITTISASGLLVARDDVGSDSKDDNGRTPLSWAAGHGQETAVKLLLDSGKVDADSKDKYGRTPLSHAAEKGHEAVVKLLVERDDVEADSNDKYNRTPLS